MHFGIVQMPLLDGSFSFALGIQSRGGILYDWQENGRDVRSDEPGQDDGLAAHGRARGAHLDRERRRLVRRDWR